MPEYLDDVMGLVWVQPDGPNTTVYPMLCTDLDSIDSSHGTVSTRYCRTSNGDWRQIHRSQGSPGDVTFDLETWMPKTQTWLQRQSARRCAMPIYIVHSDCAPDNVFLNYDTVKFVEYGIIESTGESGLVKTRAEGEEEATTVGLTFSINAPYPVHYIWNMVETVHIHTGEDQELRDVSFCNAPQCVSDCSGTVQDVCDDGVAVANFDTGQKADYWITRNGGATWATSTATPFAVSENLATVVCFSIDRATTRILMGVGTTAASATQVAYTDDWGLTWSAVITWGTANNFFMHSGGLFALDHRHVWGGNDQGEIYFSSDGGATWATQNSPVTEEIYYIHFRDSNYGWAVGDARTVVYTNDGGTHWNVPTGTPGDTGTDIVTCVSTIDQNRAWVGVTNAGKTDGELYYTTDTGVVWTERALPLAPTIISDVMFLDEFCGFACGIYNDGSHDYVILYRTFNGGMDWEYHLTDDYIDSAISLFGANALWACSCNEAFVVGEIYNAYPLIWEVQNTLPA